MPFDPPLLQGPPEEPLDRALRTAVVQRLQDYLGQGRLRHVQGVADSAVALAQRFAPQLTRKAEIAGLLHDNAKKLRDDQLTQLAARFDIGLSPGDCETPQLLHGKVGAALLPERFGVEDSEIAQAVADHVTGRPEMGMLSQLLYVADQLEPGRDFPGVAELRALAEQDLRAAVACVARHKIEYVLEKGQWLDPLTLAVWNNFRTGWTG